MPAAFPQTALIQHEGPRWRNPLAFKHYNAGEEVEGKTMREHLRFAVVYWHTFRGKAIPSGRREGYMTLLNTDLKRERNHLAALLHMAVDYKQKLGFKGQFYIEPKPKEPTKHQYDSDAAACLNFLREYELLPHFKLNLETNHAQEGEVPPNTSGHQEFLENSSTSLSKLLINYPAHRSRSLCRPLCRDMVVNCRILVLRKKHPKQIITVFNCTRRPPFYNWSASAADDVSLTAPRNYRNQNISS